ncbi:MAG: ABC transporter ATP-binding protein [Acidothermus cellulolyticus]|nr:ABC transporter ATP-binding protein [Acidothermus cellulolyticus]
MTRTALTAGIPATTGTSVTQALEARGLVKTYRTRHGPIIANDGIDLSIRPGQIFGLLGPNGAGKTTLVRQLVGLLRPDAGRIALLGIDATAHPEAVPRIVAYLPQQDTALADLTVAQAVRTTAVLRGIPRSAAGGEAAALLAELGLEPLADRRIGKLSGGQRRLAAVAATLAGRRPILVLDEPTTGLDPTARRAVWAAVERRRTEAGCTVVLVTHNVLEAETVLDAVAILDQGRVIANGTPGALKATLGDAVRLELAWRADPPDDDPLIRRLRAAAAIRGRRWTVRCSPEEARAALAQLTSGDFLDVLDDFTLATPSLEDVYVALGGRDRLDRE